MDVYLSEDVDQAVGLLSGHISAILDEMAPMRTIQNKTNYCPWISKDNSNDEGEIKVAEACKKQ